MFKQIITNYGLRIDDSIKTSKVSYADDTVLIAESEDEPNNLLNEIATKGQDWLIEINMKRTKKIMIVRNKGHKSMGCFTENKKMEQVSTFS